MGYRELSGISGFLISGVAVYKEGSGSAVCTGRARCEERTGCAMVVNSVSPLIGKWVGYREMGGISGNVYHERTVKVVLFERTVKVGLFERTVRVGLFERTVRVGLFERTVKVVLCERTVRVGLFERTVKVVLFERTVRVGLFERTVKVGLFV